MGTGCEFQGLDVIDFDFRFRRGMVDALNAEIALGTVAGLGDAVRWLGYTYLFVRMRKNPVVYGKTSEHPFFQFSNVRDQELGTTSSQTIRN